jgi:putative pyruvate formate lyase activating enzyme
MTVSKAEIIYPRLEKARSLLEKCILCPRRCKVNRLAGKKGFCKLAGELVVSTISVHHGEEPPISGNRGSGTVFFGSCNLLCVFCQNYPISHLAEGKVMAPEALAEGMLSLQDRGVHNINLVTPTHLVPQIMEALYIAFSRGLNIPIVYNTGGYDSLETLTLLDGIMDIYMPDMKYSDNTAAKMLSNVSDYTERNREAVIEMHRQVGDFQINDDGIGVKGLLIRHLVLPNGLAGTRDTMQFIAVKLSGNTYISLMSQYFPDGTAHDLPQINRRITAKEYAEAQSAMEEAGLFNGWMQERGIDESIFNIRRFLDEKS